MHVNGVSLTAGAEARAQVGLVSHASMLYGALTVRENVELAARLHGLVGSRGRRDGRAGAAWEWTTAPTRRRAR